MTIVSGALAGAPDVPLVLGVHIVSPLASDLIAEAEQLVGNRVPLAAAARLIHPHPTFSESFGEALLKADGRPLHQGKTAETVRYGMVPDKLPFQCE